MAPRPLKLECLAASCQAKAELRWLHIPRFSEFPEGPFRARMSAESSQPNRGAEQDRLGSGLDPECILCSRAHVGQARTP